MKMVIMNKILIVLSFVTLFPLTSMAQWGDIDIPTIEAYIKDHKAQRSLLLARSTVESANRALHDLSSKSAVDYKNISNELDKYCRAFDIIDLVYKSTQTAFNVGDTYSTLKNRIGDYQSMLSDFYDKCLSRGKVVSTDTLIVSVNRRCIQNVVKDAESIWRSMTDLVLYATGAVACTVTALMEVMDDINYSLDNIRLHINKAYFDTWRYIQLRIGYWKAEVYRARTIKEITEGAFGRWVESSYLKLKGEKE